MEFLIRAAVEKFFASGQVESELDAVIKFNEEFIKPKCEKFNQTAWRFENTFNVYVDNVMKAYEPIFKKIWTLFSGKHKKPGQRVAMMQDEFEDFVITSGLINDGLAQRECAKRTLARAVEEGRQLPMATSRSYRSVSSQAWPLLRRRYDANARRKRHIPFRCMYAACWCMAATWCPHEMDV